MQYNKIYFNYSSIKFHLTFETKKFNKFYIVNLAKSYKK